MFEKQIQSKNLKNKQLIATMALILILTAQAIIASVPAVKGNTEFQTYAFVTVAPNPVGVSQTVEIAMWLANPPPGAEGPEGTRWQGYTVIVTKPDGTTQSLGPFNSDATGGTFTRYTPTIIGNYTIQMNFPGQNITGYDALGNYFDYSYTPSTSPKATLVVQQQPITSPPQVPLPTAYWTNPIEATNSLWSTISGNWLAVGSSWPFGPSNDQLGTFNPYTTAPNEPHVMWTKPLAFGGLVGGNFNSTGYYTGEEYERKFYPGVIISGVLYYDQLSAPQYGFTAVDLRTGQTLWTQNSTGQAPTIIGYPGNIAVPGISMGQIYNYESPNQEGAYAYLWSQFGTTWSMYDAYTGNWILNIANVPYGALVANTLSELPYMLDSQGDLIVYALDDAAGTLTMWNSSLAIPTPAAQGTAIWSFGTGEWCYRPPQGATLDWNSGIQWNVTIPPVADEQYLAISAVTPNAILAVTGNYFLQRPGWQMEVGYSATTGQQLWAVNRTLPVGITDWEVMGPVGDGVFTEFDKVTMQWNGYSLATGKQIWGPTTPYTNAWGMYNEGNPGCYVSANGLMYVSGYDGEVHCYSITTGNHLWDFSTGSSGFNTPYGTYPVEFQAIADGKDYICTGNHHNFQPMFKGEHMDCINATTGKELWSVSGWFDNPVVADGYLAAFNDYDNQIFCFGMGPSKTTITAPDIGATTATPITITGSVTDICAGSSQQAVSANFPNGLPCVSDASMTQFMEAVYEQQPMPSNTTGVPVTFTVLDSNGNYRTIGTTTTNALGDYSFTWTPNIPGNYTMYATFAGTQSYYGSSASTGFYASSLAATAAPTASPLSGLASTNTVMLGVAAIIVVIIIGIVALAMIMLRKRP